MNSQDKVEQYGGDYVIKRVGDQGPSSNDQWEATKKQRETFLVREIKIMLQMTPYAVPGVAGIVAATRIHGSPAIIMEKAGST